MSQLVGEGRALEAEVERLGAEREERHRGDEEDRQLARLDVDPAREPGPLGGGDRHRGAGDEAGDAGGRVQRQDQRVAVEDRQQVAGSRGRGQARQVDRRQVRGEQAGDEPDRRQQRQRDRQAEREPAAQHRQGRPLQASIVSRVSCIPCEKTCWFAARIGVSHRHADGADSLRVELRGLEPLTSHCQCALFQLSYSPRIGRRVYRRVVAADAQAACCSGPWSVVEVEDRGCPGRCGGP